MAARNGNYRATVKLSRIKDTELVNWVGEQPDKEYIFHRALAVLKTIDKRTDNALVVELTSRDNQPVHGATIIPHVHTKEGWERISSLSTDEVGRIYLIPPNAPLAMEIPNQVAIGKSKTEVYPTLESDRKGTSGWVPIEPRSGMRLVKIKVDTHDLGESVITMLDDGDAIEIDNDVMIKLARYTLRKMALEEMLERTDIQESERNQWQRNLTAAVAKIGQIYQTARADARESGRKVPPKKRAKRHARAP